MSASAIGATGVVVLFVLLILRVPVWISLILVGFFGNVIVLGWQGAFALAGTAPFDVASAYTLSVVPLFILMGEVASESRLSGELFNAARVILSGFRGGLAVATLAASALFGAVSGSSLANAATMTRMALPELRKAGYDDGLATGCIAAGGSTDILIPPSIILVIYAAIAELSVPKLLAAGLIPGLVLTGLYMAVALVVVYFRPQYAPDRESYSAWEKFLALREPWQFLALFIVTIGGIYAGIFSPTEAASIGAFGAILLGIAGRRMSLRDLLRAIENSVVVSGVLFVIVMGANLFSFFIVQTHLPELLLSGARAVNFSGLMVMVLIIIGYIVMGCFLEGIGMVLITVPVFQPIIVQFGYDPIWFAIIVVIMVEVGLIHPPVGMNLFVIQAQAPDVRITSIYRGIVPFLLAPLLLIILLFLFPGLALWLPKALYG
ncbi:MAG TPA: TRAP transporter large permease [Xanthobacteraceae bacterium]|nr:TRAP transporter large permease [Xanthobacteraceae bacterium]